MDEVSGPTLLGCHGCPDPMCYSCMASCSVVWSEDAKYFSWMPRVLREGVLRLRHKQNRRGWPEDHLNTSLCASAHRWA